MLCYKKSGERHLWSPLCYEQSREAGLLSTHQAIAERKSYCLSFLLTGERNENIKQNT